MLTQFCSVACREYTLPRDDPASQAKGWIQGNMRIGPVLEVTTSFQHFKTGIEIRIWSVNQDNSQSWVRISYGTVKYVVDSIQDNTEIPADPQEERVPQTSIKVVAARSKAKAKPQPRVLVGTTATIPIHETRWIDIEPSEQNLASYDLSKKVVNLLRHNQTLQREEDGAIEFYKIKFYLRNHHSQIQVWSDDRWKACLAARGGSKRRYQHCSDDSGTILYIRALQGHSGSNLIDPTLQDNVVIGTGIFNYIYHIGCAFNLHSIINNGLVPGGQNLSRRQTVFFLPIDPRDTDHKDPEHIDFSVPRPARYVHSAWKRHQDAVFWVDIDLAIHVLNSPNHTNPNPIQSVIDRGNLRTQNVFLWIKETSRSQEIDDKRLHKELGSSDTTGKPVKLSEDIRVMHAHDGTGEPVKSSASTHTQWKNLFLPNIVTLHHLTRTSSTLQPTRRISISTSQECRIRW